MRRRCFGAIGDPYSLASLRGSEMMPFRKSFVLTIQVILGVWQILVFLVLIVLVVVIVVISINLDLLINKTIL